jgi:hypothetical protein
MKNPSKEMMKRVAKPMVEREEDWQNTLEAVKDHFDMDATEENRELIMDVIRECEDDLAEAAWLETPPQN